MGLVKSVGLSLGAAVAFTLAYSIPWGGFLMAGFLGCLFALVKFGSSRQAFYLGLMVGMLIYPAQLFWFHRLFGAAAIVLWLILSFTLALMLLLARLCFARFNPVVAGILFPFLWTGFEYFRSELYYLRFSWVNVGFAFSSWRVLPLRVLGVYGAGFLMASYAAVLLTARRNGIAAGLIVCISALLALWPAPMPDPGQSLSQVHITGVQIESPSEAAVIMVLNQLARKFPQTEVFVFSEYTFDSPVPDRVRA